MGAVSTSTDFPVRVDTTTAVPVATNASPVATRDSISQRLDAAREALNTQRPGPHTTYRVTNEMPRLPVAQSSFGDYSFILLVVLVIVFLVVVFFRSKRGHKRADVVTRRKLENIRNREEDPERAPEPKWSVRDIEEGGRFHLSLPNGLEEDFTVTRRDRVDRPDERVEYDLLLRGPDPYYTVSLNWWAMGVGAHAWLMEETAYTIDGLGLTADALREMRTSGTGTLSFREKGIHAGLLRPVRPLRGWQAPGGGVPAVGLHQREGRLLGGGPS